MFVKAPKRKGLQKLVRLSKNKHVVGTAERPGKQWGNGYKIVTKSLRNIRPFDLPD